MGKRILLIAYIAVTLSLITQFHEIKAQQADTTNRPEIGLVLSGGAAKGLAHVGVLKVLEEAGIRPDYITGSSMGAIVGGLYALGYSADELMKLMETTDWDKILTDRVPLHKIVMEEKYDYNRFIVEFPIRDGEFKFPSGLNEGYQLERLFSDLTWRATGIHDFDSLSIPFHCMAVDIIEGKPVELDSGNLSQAIRASMAIPGVFAPVRKDSMLLVDGGVIRNFPVQEVRDMGADIVIGVYVGFEEDVTPEDLYSLTDVLSRTITMYGVFDSQEQKRKTDILIEPDMEGIQSFDFMRGRKIAQRGEEAARAIYDTLRQITNTQHSVYDATEKLTDPDYVYISEVEVENLRYVEPDFVTGKGGIFPGTYVTRERINKAVENIFGTRYFNRVNYRLEHQTMDIYKLVYVVKEGSQAFVKGGLHYDNVQGTGLIVNTTFRNYLMPASRINLTLNMAEQPGVKFDVNRYFGKEQHLMDNYFIHWYRTELPVYYEDEKIGEYTHGMFKGGVGGKYSINVNQQIGVDAFYESSTIYPDDALQSIFPEVNFENYGFGGIALHGYYRLNNQDDQYFPTKGTKMEASFKRVFKPISKYRIKGDQTLDEQIFSLNLQPFNAFNFNLDHYFKISRRLSLKLGTAAGLASTGTPVTNNYTLGGVMHDEKLNYETMAGFQSGERIVPNFLKANGGMDFRILSRVFLTLDASITHTSEKVHKMYSSFIDSNWNDYLKGYAVGLRLNSGLGPLVVMVGDNNIDQKPRWYVNLGYTF
ncbi:MAG: patatin-like phospholipase family protein [Bacteroidales bacterium]|nr:patatin-like phospholipase family protein [Bacteroidales bacterium]